MALINGNISDNVLTGTDADDAIFGFAGNDTISGGAGPDRLFGDVPGNTTVGGNDILSGGAGSDLIVGGPGFDIAVFDLPRRAYTGQVTELDLSVFDPEAPTAVQGTIMGAGFGPTLEVDFLLEVDELRFPDGRIVRDGDDPVAGVYRVFEAALDRAPDPTSLNAWGAQVAAGKPLGAVAVAVAQSPEFQARYGALDNAAFVNRIHENATGRTAEADVSAVWVGALNAGSATRADLLATFANTQEAKENAAVIFDAGIWDQDEKAAQLARLYDAAFDRAPDFEGFMSNKALLDGGLSLEQLAREFAQTPEFAAAYGGPNPAPAALVEALYANTLDRPAEAAGRSYWTQQVASGAVTREQAIVAFAESQEHQTLMMPSIEGGIVFA